jgi:hypothetical protein
MALYYSKDVDTQKLYEEAPIGISPGEDSARPGFTHTQYLIPTSTG